MTRCIMEARNRKSIPIAGRGLAVAAVFVLLSLPGSALPAEPTDDVVRDDWYLRESLVAIDDWETICANEESGTWWIIPANGVGIRIIGGRWAHT